MIRDVDCDVLVIGSGAGGLSSAVVAAKHGLKVIVAEKASWIGGTTARSGGYLWVPGNPHNAGEGIVDTKDAARTYLKHETANHYDSDRIDAFLDNAPDMIEFFERETEVKFQAAPTFSDYHPDAPGAVVGGRSILTTAYDGRRLGKMVKKLRPPLKEITFLGMMLGSSQEVKHFFDVTRSATSALYVARRLVQHVYEVLVHGRAMRLTNGNALIGRLLRSAMDLDVAIWTSAPAEEILVENDRAVCARVSTAAGPVRVRASRGIVLAAGGFPNNPKLRARLFPHAPTGQEHYSPAPAENTGDGIAMARHVGAAVEEGYPNAAAWIPVSRVPGPRGTSGVFPHLIDRYKPGVIAVDKNGRRFVNEANSYHDFAQAMQKAPLVDGQVGAWLIADHRAIRRYGLGIVKPFPMPMSRWLKSGYVLRSRTPRGLAALAGFDAAQFEETLQRFNRDAQEGHDTAFNKGGNAYNRFIGDPLQLPNPCVAPLVTPPFYAIRLVVGDLGTFAGVKTNGRGEVLRENGVPIIGLYAAGNDMASIMGGAYPGGGITLGPAMTFGFIVGAPTRRRGHRAGNEIRTRRVHTIKGGIACLNQYFSRLRRAC